MKIIAAALLMLLGSAHALPTLTEDERRQERLITDTIIGIIENVAATIAERFDPVTVDEWSGSFALSEEEIFSASAHLSEFRFEGLSNIRIDTLSFSILQMRLQLALTLPSISVRIGSAGFDLATFGNELSGSASGSLEIREVGISANVRVSIGISGVSIRSLDVVPKLGGIDSALSIVINDNDLSETINDFLNNRLPNFLAENKATIQELLEAIVIIIVDRLL